MPEIRPSGSMIPNWPPGTSTRRFCAKNNISPVTKLATIEIRQVIVLAREKDRTKTKEDRTVELCPRALSVLKRQFALREQYLRAGKIDHDLVFFKDDGGPIRSLKYPYMRRRGVMEKLGLRYRDSYIARHSCVSWRLMLGRNLMWCARQHGHSVPVMLPSRAPEPLPAVGKWYNCPRSPNSANKTRPT